MERLNVSLYTHAFQEKEYSLRFCEERFDIKIALLLYIGLWENEVKFVNKENYLCTIHNQLQIY